MDNNINIDTVGTSDGLIIIGAPTPINDWLNY